MRLALASTLLLALVAPARAGSVLTDFESVSVGGPEGYLIDGGASGGWTVDGNFFNNDYGVDPLYGPYWSGWAFASQSAQSSGQAFGQYLAMPSDVAGATNTYGVATAYADPGGQYSTQAYIDLAPGRVASSILVTNTEYVYRTITEGFGYGGGQFTTNGQYLRLRIEGQGASDGVVRSEAIDLAVFENNALDILTSWKLVDLTFLGDSTRINLSFETNVSNQFGPLIPTYAAFDDLITTSAVPEPSGWLLMGLGAFGVAAVRRRRA